MPAWGLTLSDLQLADLTSYIRELALPSRQKYPRTSVLDVQQQLELGRTLYVLYCVACHGRNGQGDGPLVEVALKQGILGHPPPDFTTGILEKRTNLELRAMAMSSPEHAHLELHSEDNRWWHRPLTEEETGALAFFLRAQSLVHKH